MAHLEISPDRLHLGARFAVHLTQVKTITARDAERGEPTQGETSLDMSAAHIRTVRRDDTGATRHQSSSSETTEQA
jgi:hypothetical protein